MVYQHLKTQCNDGSSSHNTATLIADLRKNLNLGIGDSTAKDLSFKRIRVEENAVKKCYVLISSWTKPFTEASDIFYLSSRSVPCYEVQYDLPEAQKIRQLCSDTLSLRELKQTTLIFMHLSRKILSVLSKRKIKTVRLNVLNQKIAIRANRETFARLLLIQQK